MKKSLIVFFVFAISNVFAQNADFSADTNWIPQGSGTDDRLIKVYFKDSQQGIIAGQRSLLQTFDGGETWFLDDTLVQPYERIVDFFTKDNIVFWMILEEDTLGKKASKDNNVYHVLQSIDSTETWNVLYTDEQNYLSSIYFTDSLNGWIAGAEGRILNTSDGGITWNEQSGNDNVILRDILFLDTLTGFAVGENTSIMKTTNGGTDWVAVGDDLPFSTLNTIAGFGEGNLWIGGSNGMIFYSSDNGTTWQENQLGISDYIYDFYFKTEKIGWACSSSGRLYYTLQGATNWKISDTLGDYNLNGIVFADDDNGWIIGDQGLILHTANGAGELSVPYHSTHTRALKVYPNPVRESIYLKPDFDDQGTAILLDNNGKMLLKNELFLVSGVSEKLWNLRNFPPGVYLLKWIGQKEVLSVKILKDM